MSRERCDIALVPSPFPASIDATDRMLATLRDASLTVTENALSADAAADESSRSDHPEPRMMFVDPGATAGVRSAPLNDPPPVEFLFEIPDDTPAARLADWAHHVHASDVYWSLTTESAMRMTSPSRAFATAVVRAAGRPGTQDLMMRIETALHETVANAIVHGNLGLPSLSKLEGDDQSAAYQEAVQAGLADPDLARRRVDISAQVENGCLTIQVRDEGDGMPEESWHQSLQGGESALTEAQKSGRGLYLTSMFCDSLQRAPDGRAVHLCFELGEATA